jgi:branched-chain amino acid transport system substrate-binding protein
MRGIRVVAMSDVTDDDLLNNMGDAALGVVSGGPYATHHQSEESRAFVARFRQANAGMRPNIVGVSAWDGMVLLKRALEATNGNTGGDALLAAMKGQSWESPRGPVTVDANARDIVQNVYMRRVERVDGELHNVEF